MPHLLMALGVIVVVLGWAWIIKIAWRENKKSWIFWIIILNWIGVTVFAIRNWQHSSKPFWIYWAGIALLIVGGQMAPTTA